MKQYECTNGVSIDGITFEKGKCYGFPSTPSTTHFKLFKLKKETKKVKKDGTRKAKRTTDRSTVPG